MSDEVHGGQSWIRICIRLCVQEFDGEQPLGQVVWRRLCDYAGNDLELEVV
jgi:hypothetical protein